MTLTCTQCPWQTTVSDEDPDASLSDLWAHLSYHTQDRREQEKLFTQAQENAI